MTDKDMVTYSLLCEEDETKITLVLKSTCAMSMNDFLDAVQCYITDESENLITKEFTH